MSPFFRAEILFIVQNYLVPAFSWVSKLDKIHLFVVPIALAGVVIWYAKLPTLDDLYLWSLLMLVLFSQFLASRLFIRYINWELQRDL